MKFDADYDQMIRSYNHAQKIEITEHLLRAIDYIINYVQSKDAGDWGKYADAETELLKKYRSDLQPYANAQLYKYFDFRRVLGAKDIIPLETLNAMKSAQEQSLSDEEIGLFLEDTKRSLSNALYFLYLSDKKEADEPITLNDSIAVTDETDKDITKARQLLAIYYFLKASLGIEGRDSNSSSCIARFVHLLTGTKFTTIQNSDIYKKYLQMPNYKTDGKLIEDLKFIRPYFIDLGLESGVKMIDEEIQRAIKELPFNERKKYKD
ncbi:hypothetical protein [Flavipsychrobacter stenotrophus]|nr:hypothetical protein [Flavipsychrobacter stenotrophus]